MQRVRIAYDADDAGERAAQRDTERFQKHGIEVFRVKFPHGMDANEYACKVKPADKSLALLMNAAQWAETHGHRAAPPPEPRKHVAMVVDELTGDPLPIVDKESLETGVGWAPEPFVPAPYADVQAQSSLLAASVSSAPDAAKKEKATSLEQRGDAWFMDMEGREYRVAGLEKTVGTDALKIALRLRHGERFHLDQVDLCRDMERRRFVERAAEETGLTADLLKRDLGKLLLAVEQAQTELSKPQEQTGHVVTLTPEEREAALTWLREPNLIGRLRAAFHQAGIIGEETNTLVAYLAGVSRKLERPLAIIIQSASAAGKTTLMDAVLSFLPGRRARQILGHDRPEPLLPGRNESQTQNPRGGRGGRSGESQLCVEAVAERRRANDSQHRQRPGHRQNGDAGISRRRPGDDFFDDDGD